MNKKTHGNKKWIWIVAIAIAMLSIGNMVFGGFGGAESAAGGDVVLRPQATVVEPSKYQAVITAANAMTFPEDGSNYTAQCPHCEQEVEWIPFYKNSSRLIGNASKAVTHYYLAEDMTDRAEGMFTWNGAACIHLNGKNYTTGYSSAFTGCSGNPMTIMGNGTVHTTDASSAVFMGNGGTINIYGGTYTSAGPYGYRAITRKDVANFYGGTIGTSKTYSVYIARAATFNMYGGAISGQRMTSDKTGNVDSFFNIYGGTITGDGIEMICGQLNIQGGNICKAVFGVQNTAVKISGNPVIGELDLTGTNALITVGEMTDGASVTVKGKDLITGAVEDPAAVKDYFHAAESGKEIVAQQNGLYCKVIDDTADENTENNPIAAAANAMQFPTDGTAYTALCPYCDEEVQWVALTAETDCRLGDANADSKHYYLADNVNRNDSLTARNSSVCLHLNGYRLRSTSASTISGRVGNEFTIMGKGTVSNDSMTTVVVNFGTINIFGGEYHSGGSYVFNAIRDTDVLNFYAGSINSSRFYGAYAANGANINLYGGIVNGQEIMTDDNSAVESTITVKGGIVAGDGIVVDGGTVDVQGGEINKIVCNENAGTVKLSGAPEITILDLKKSEIVATVGELTTGANIGIRNKQAVFTKDVADPSAIKDYFFPAETGGEIAVEGSALAYIPPEPDYAAISAAAAAMTFPTNGSSVVQYCPHCEKDVTWKPWYSDSSRLTGSATVAHYYVAEEIVRDENFFVWNGPICVNLNNKSITTTSDSVFTGKENHPITIMGNGNVTAAGEGATVFSVNYGTINIYGGAYTSAGSTIFASARATDVVNIYGGTFGDSGNYTASFIGGGSFNMYGGEITGKPVYASTASAGKITVRRGTIAEGIIIDNGRLDIRGGTIGGAITCGDGVDEIKLSGAPVIEKLDMSAAKVTADISELTVGEEGASIGIFAKGVFTNDLETPDAAEAAKAAFRALDAVSEIVVEGNALGFAGGMVESNHATVIAAAQAMKASGQFTHYTAEETAPSVSFACPVCGSNQTFKPLTVGGNINAGGTKHYYIASETLDIGSSGFYGNHPSGVVHVYLNDSNIVASGTKDGYLVKSYGKFALFGDGNITLSGTAGGIFKAQSDGTIDIYGGTYTTTTAPYVAWMTSATGNINLYGGTLSGGANQTVYVEKGNFNVYGGAISGNATSIMSTGSSATDGYVNIYGGIVSGNVIMDNGNLLVQRGTIAGIDCKATVNAAEIYGYPKISMLTVAEGVKIKMRAFFEGADVTVNANGVFTQDFASAEAAEAAAEFITVANNAGEVEVEGKALTASSSPWLDVIALADAMEQSGNFAYYSEEETAPSVSAVCPVCGVSKTFTALTAGGNVNAGGTKHYYIARETLDVGRSGIYGAHPNGVVHLYLNNSTIIGNATAEDDFIFRTYGEFSVFGNGNVIQQADTGAVLRVYNAGSLNIYGGTYSTTTAPKAAKLYGPEGGVLNFYAGTISGGTSYTVYMEKHVNGSSATMNLYGGTITGNATSIVLTGNGNASTVNISGTTITGDVAVAAGTVNVKGGAVASLTATGGTVKLSSRAKINDLTLTGVLANVGKLKVGAQIGVTADGVFTTEFASADAAAAALARFTAKDETMEIVVDGLTLSCVPKA